MPVAAGSKNLRLPSEQIRATDKEKKKKKKSGESGSEHLNRHRANGESQGTEEGMDAGGKELPSSAACQALCTSGCNKWNMEHITSAGADPLAGDSPVLAGEDWNKKASSGRGG